jgi:hypothetical protein
MTTAGLSGVISAKVPGCMSDLSLPDGTTDLAADERDGQTVSCAALATST